MALATLAASQVALPRACQSRPFLGVAPVPASCRPAKLQSFKTWLEKFGHDKCNLKLHEFTTSTEQQGFGTIAGRGGVVKGSIVVRVPNEAFMNVETAKRCPELIKILEHHDLSSWQTLCLHLLWERNLGEASFWHPYLGILPEEVSVSSSHPLLWSEADRQEWLAGSPLLHEMEKRLHQVKEDSDALLSTRVNEVSPPGKSKSPLVSEASVRWAAMILLSRAFALDLQPEDDDLGTGQVLTLVPWADMLNHSSEAGDESRLVYDYETRTAVLRAHKDYAQGEQVFDSYGPRLTPGQLLLDYGFVDSANENHAIELPASLLGPEAAGPANGALLEAIGLPMDGAMFPLTPSGTDETVMAWTRACLASEAQLRKAGWLEAPPGGTGRRRRPVSDAHSRAAMAMAYFSQPVGRQNEGKVLNRLLRAATAALARYPSSLEEDMDALRSQQVQRQGKVVAIQWGHQQALRAVVSEKKALTGASAVLKEMLDSLAKMPSTK